MTLQLRGGRENRLEIGVLHGFRALMVLFVANFHFWQQGWLPQYFTVLGVQIDADFFTRASYLFVDGMMLLSGFLLYLPYARHRAEGTPEPLARRFYVNRLIRILPSYLFSVLTCLLLFALPQGQYASAGARNLDVLTHLTFTFTFFRNCYQFTPINGVLWTIAIEMQFYLVFPLLARAARKHLTLTLVLMALAGIGYRAFVSLRVPDTAMYINQLPSFLDVYALGMLGAVAYCGLQKQLADMGRVERRCVSAAALVVFALSLPCLLALLGAQSTASLAGQEALRLSQLRLRLPLALTLLACMLAAAHMPALIRKLLDNRLMRFLSTISFNFYIWHQFLAVRMARSWFSTDALHADHGLQCAYTLLCWSVSIVVAMLATYGIEKPAARLANRTLDQLEKRRQAKPD
ncbi:MAG: acyltransferase [Clostridia bacterium]